MLTALFMGANMDEQTALARRKHSSLTASKIDNGNLTSIAWMIDALGNNNPVITALARGDYVTTKQLSIHGGHRGGRAVWTRLSAREIHFRHQRRHAQNFLSPGFEPARLGAGRKSPGNSGVANNTP